MTTSAHSVGSLKDDPAATVAAARRGDLDALGRLYVTHADGLLATAFRLLLSREDAEDVVHDLFVGLPEALRRYEERGALDAWLRRVCVRLALSRLRSPERRGVGIENAATFAARSSDPALRTDLAAALAALTPALRAVLVLKEVEGYSHAEIGEMIGISRAASEVRLHRALRALRRTLNDWEERNER